MCVVPTEDPNDAFGDIVHVEYGWVPGTVCASVGQGGVGAMPRNVRLAGAWMGTCSRVEADGVKLVRILDGDAT